ncbi:hypothetical protein RIF29_15179 [Crotalaria pallida]|uniref:Uncharacterized protein n=1 Tax=Crotalaria pallida TaxID=3830 RepID=A0AAN9IEE7_CROPI
MEMLNMELDEDGAIWELDDLQEDFEIWEPEEEEVQEEGPLELEFDPEKAPAVESSDDEGFYVFKLRLGRCGWVERGWVGVAAIRGRRRKNKGRHGGVRRETKRDTAEGGRWVLVEWRLGLFHEGVGRRGGFMAAVMVAVAEIDGASGCYGVWLGRRVAVLLVVERESCGLARDRGEKRRRHDCGWG